MADLRKHSSTSNLIRFTLKHATTGAGLTGLTSATSGLIISTICDNEASATTYTAAGSTVEGITTLGTFAAPTATKCRFKEVDATNHKGLYEFQFADARFSVASAKRLVISVTGAANLLDADYEVQLTQVDMYSATPSDSAGVTTLLGRIVGTLAAGTHNAQSGDAYSRIGATGSSLTSLAQASVCTETRLAELDAANMPTDLANIIGYIDTEIAAILADTGTTLDGKLDTIDANVDAILADTGTDGVTLSAAQMNKIADHVLRRGFAAAAASADGDAKAFRSLLGAVAKLVNKVSISASTLSMHEADDSTVLGTQTLTTDAAAEPITGADTN